MAYECGNEPRNTQPKWTFGVRPIWLQMMATGVLLMAASATPQPLAVVGGFMVGIAVALWR